MAKIAHVLESYQNEEAVPRTLRSLRETGKGLLNLFCGTGKTITAAKILKLLLEENKDLKILWCTHRDELLYKSKEVLEEYLGLPVGVYNASEKTSKRQVTIASIPTLHRTKSLEKFSKDQGILVFDECHHIAAASWLKIYNFFPEARKLGLTATRFRTDRQSVTDYFGEPEVILSYDEALSKKMVARIDGWVVLTNSVIKGLPGKEDWAPEQLDKLFESKDRNKIIIESYKKYGRTAMGKQGLQYKTICYCINVDHAERMTRLFQRNGISAKSVTHKTKAEERKGLMSRFTHGFDIEVLCVANILNEGVDIPLAACGILAAPTRSYTVYTQRVGRIVRLLKNKNKCVLLDLRDNTDTAFQSYCAANVTQRQYKPENIIVDYVTTKDPVVKEQRVADVMFRAREFEEFQAEDSTYWKSVILDLVEKPRVGDELYLKLTDYRRRYPEFREKTNDKWCWQSDDIGRKKSEILALPRKPKSGDRYYVVYLHYISKDADFRKKTQEKWPSQQQITSQKRKELLSRKDRPKKGDSCYPNFQYQYYHNLDFKLRADKKWPTTRALCMREYKKKILSLKEKPQMGDPLYNRMVWYRATDPDFFSEIEKRLWSRSSKSAQIKSEILGLTERPTLATGQKLYNRYWEYRKFDSEFREAADKKWGSELRKSSRKEVKESKKKILLLKVKPKMGDLFYRRLLYHRKIDPEFKKLTDQKWDFSIGRKKK